MIAIIWTLIGGFRGVLIAGAVAAATIATAAVYDRLIDDPGVVRTARAGFVLESERDALVARLAEEHRQRKAAETASDWLRIEIAGRDAQAAIDAEKTELEIADYEKKLANAGRSCSLDDADIDWLTR